MNSLGITLSFIALFAWGFGDFFIQKTARALGSWKALFYIGISALVILFPFVWKELDTLSGENLLILVTLSLVVVVAAIFDFEALRAGKIAIIEPVLGLELPITVALSVILLSERLNPKQIFDIALVFSGIVLAITTHLHHLKIHRRIFEKGVILAGIGAVGMALNNFLVGYSSIHVSPIMTIWFAHGVLGIISLLVLILKGNLNIKSDIRKHKGIILGESILDNSAWLAYAGATSIVPISIATTISESYIILAAMLGIYINKEKLKLHQIFGAALAVLGIILLSGVS